MFTTCLSVRTILKLIKYSTDEIFNTCFFGLSVSKFCFVLIMFRAKCGKDTAYSLNLSMTRPTHLRLLIVTKNISVFNHIGESYYIQIYDCFEFKFVFSPLHTSATLHYVSGHEITFVMVRYSDDLFCWVEW